MMSFDQIDAHHQLKRSHKTNFSGASLSKERSFIKAGKDAMKRRSHTMATINTKANKPTMEIYRPPNIRCDGQQIFGKLNVHAKEFQMHDLQNSRSTTNIPQGYELNPLQHSKSSGHLLRHPLRPGIISFIPGSLNLIAATQPLNFPRVNFQVAKDAYYSPVVANASFRESIDATEQLFSSTPVSNPVKRSKSLGASDARSMEAKSKNLPKDSPDLDAFSGDNQENLKLAVEDPNQLQSRTLMELVKTILERVVEGIRYSEPGAKVCMSIIESEKTHTFIETLTNTCQQWYQQRDKLLRGIKAGDGTRFSAFMWFLTEMCGQLKRHKHQCHFDNMQPDLLLLSVLAKCCQACVTPPIKCAPETECLFFVLTSIGRDLENELPMQLEQLFVGIRDSFLASDVTPAVRRTLLQLIELHASNWQLPASSVLYYYPRVK